MRPRSMLLVVLVLFFLIGGLSAQKTVEITVSQLRFCEAEAHIQTMYCFLPTFGLQQFELLGLPPVFLPGLLPGTQISDNLSSLAGTELSLLPIPSPASGITFTFDPQLGVVVPSRESLGPILSDRAETIGRNRVFVGFAYQHFGFDSFEGRSLRQSESLATGTLATSIDDFTVDQFTSYLSYGITSRVELSAIVPVRRVKMAASGFGAVVDPIAGVVTGVVPVPTTTREQTGVGDISFRLKGTVWKREHGGVALGLDVRTPTGDALNFMGAGAYGVKPFLAASVGKKLGKVYLAPHANIGFEFNGSSILGGVAVGQEGRLPRRLSYALGTEVGLTRRFTATAEFTSDRLFNALRTVQTVPDNFGLVTVTSRSVNLNNASIGAKVNPVGRLVLTGNLTWRVNNAGLRARMIPLVGASYTF